MRLNLETPRSGKQLLDAFLEAFAPRAAESPNRYWSIMGRGHRIEYDAIDMAVKRHVYRSWRAVPMCKMYFPTSTQQQLVKDPAWGDVEAISLVPVREDKMYEVVDFVLEGIETEDDEAHRKDETKQLLDKMVEKYLHALLVMPAQQAA